MWLARLTEMGLLRASFVPPKAVRRQAITIDAGPGTPDERTAIRLIHAHCRRRPPGGTDGGPALLQS